jgi:hypothetical protein
MLFFDEKRKWIPACAGMTAERKYHVQLLPLVPEAAGAAVLAAGFGTT